MGRFQVCEGFLWSLSVGCMYLLHVLAAVTMHPVEGWVGQVSAPLHVSPQHRITPAPPLFRTATSVRYFSVVDLTSANTTLVTVAVARTWILVLDPVSGQLATSPSPYQWLQLMTSAGLPCTGGVQCELVLAPGAPVVDYDTGLRGLKVAVVATGPTGLNTTLDVSVDVLALNEGAEGGAWGWLWSSAEG